MKTKTGRFLGRSQIYQFGSVQRTLWYIHRDSRREGFSTIEIFPAYLITLKSCCDSHRSDLILTPFIGSTIKKVQTVLMLMMMVVVMRAINSWKDLASVAEARTHNVHSFQLVLLPCRQIFPPLGALISSTYNCRETLLVKCREGSWLVFPEGSMNDKYC